MKYAIYFIITLGGLCNMAYAGELEQSLILLGTHLDELSRMVKLVPTSVLQSTSIPEASWLPAAAFEKSTQYEVSIDSARINPGPVWLIFKGATDFLLEAFNVKFYNFSSPVVNIIHGTNESIVKLIQDLPSLSYESDKEDNIKSIVAILFYQEFKKPGSWDASFDNAVANRLDTGDQQIWRGLRKLLRDRASEVKGSPYYGKK